MRKAVHRITWIKKGDRLYAVFRSYPLSENKPRGRARPKDYEDVRVAVKNQAELLFIAEKLGCSISAEKKWISTDKDDAYNRLLVYAVVRRSLQTPEKIERLRELVLDDDFASDAWWWASTFVEIYRREARKFGVGSRCLYKPAKAFKLLYGLAKR